ncbi:MAG: hypothetical protein AAGP08_17115, partial [Pseudomonadota bacterium]
ALTRLSEYLLLNRESGASGQDLWTVNEMSLSPAMLRTAILNRPKLRAQMLAMARRFGLTEEDVTDMPWRENECLSGCATCPSASACARMLKQTKAAAPRRIFCRNTLTFADLARNKPRPS